MRRPRRRRVYVLREPPIHLSVGWTLHVGSRLEATLVLDAGKLRLGFEVGVAGFDWASIPRVTLALGVGPALLRFRWELRRRPR